MSDLRPSEPRAPRFELGYVVATPRAIALLEAASVSALSLLYRHVRGDWGDLDAHDTAQNELAVHTGARIFSVYVLRPDAKRIWVITEANRSTTTVLLPEEY